MISKEEVLKIAKLARLELTDQEVEKMQKDLSSVLNYFDVLKKVVPEKYKVLHGKTLSENSHSNTRKDEVGEKSSSLANNLIASAPDKQDEYIKVKAVL